MWRRQSIVQQPEAEAAISGSLQTLTLGSPAAIPNNLHSLQGLPTVTYAAQDCLPARTKKFQHISRQQVICDKTI